MDSGEEDERTELIMALTMKVTVLRGALEEIIPLTDVSSELDYEDLVDELVRIRMIARAALATPKEPK